MSPTLVACNAFLAERFLQRQVLVAIDAQIQVYAAKMSRYTSGWM